MACDEHRHVYKAFVPSDYWQLRITLRHSARIAPVPPRRRGDFSDQAKFGNCSHASVRRNSAATSELSVRPRGPAVALSGYSPVQKVGAAIDWSYAGETFEWRQRLCMALKTDLHSSVPWKLGGGIFLKMEEPLHPSPLLRLPEAVPTYTHSRRGALLA